MGLFKMFAALSLLSMIVAAPNLAAGSALDVGKIPNNRAVVSNALDEVCELHVWPAERMRSMTMSLLGAGGGALGGLIDAEAHAGRDASNKSLMVDALDAGSEISALQEIDLNYGLGSHLGSNPSDFSRILASAFDSLNSL